MSFYNEQILPRFIDLAMGKAMDPIREKVTAGLSGEVLELGFGSGRNLPHVPSSVTRFLAVEPATVGRQLAAGRIAEAPFPVELVGRDGQEIPLDDGSVDHVLVTWTLCTIPDVERALVETHRVLRPGGQLHFIEHGRSPRPKVARWQDRVTPTWMKIFGGCHLNRPMDQLIETAGLRLDHIERYKMVGPEFVSFAYEGIASKPAA